MGGNSFMVEGLSGEGQTKIFFVNGRLSSESYLNILEKYLLPYAYA